KRRALAYWKIAAAVLLVMGLGIGFSILFTKENKPIQSSEITSNQNIQDEHEIGNAATVASQPANNQESTTTSQAKAQTLRNISRSNKTNVAAESDNKHSKTGNKSAVVATTAVEEKTKNRQPTAGQNKHQDAPMTTPPKQ